MAWTYGNRYLSETEKLGNIQQCEIHFSTWSVNARAAMYGNMDYESSINPAIWENLKPNIFKGYGLVQWTPASKVQNWLSANGYEITSGDGQCKRILWEKDNNQQWIATATYPYSFAQFTILELSVATLTDMWMRNYERPYLPTANLEERIKRANKWYGVITGTDPDLPVDPDEPVFPPEWVDIRSRRNKYFIACMKYWKGGK